MKRSRSSSLKGTPSLIRPQVAPLNGLRVFLSYHRDKKRSEAKVEKALRDRGVEPLSDKNIPRGENFAENIKSLILHSHLFMPLITRASKKRPWVNQEIGIAIGQSIPVLPLAIGTEPGEMIAMLAQKQAITIRPDLCDLDTELDKVNLEQIVDSSHFGVVEVADWMEERARRIVECAHYVLNHAHHGRVRIWDRLSAFAIPDKDITDPIWKGLYGTYRRSPFYYKLAREERLALQRHAENAGCDLLIDPSFPVSYARSKRKTKLTILWEFLKSKSARSVRVVCSKRAQETNLVLVGDWFAAKSRFERAGEGWGETNFTQHAPTVRREAKRFDEVFESLLEGRSPEKSRGDAITQIEKVLARIK